jgi:hypothetical protein
MLYVVAAIAHAAGCVLQGEDGDRAKDQEFDFMAAARLLPLPLHMLPSLTQCGIVIN